MLRKLSFEDGLTGAKPISTLMEPNHKLAKFTSDFFAIPDRYCRLIGKLIQLTLTRYDLAYSVHTLTQFIQSPQIDHQDVALLVVQYLKGCLREGVLLRADSPLILIAYCDSDWARCPITWCSVTRYFFSFVGSPVRTLFHVPMLKESIVLWMLLYLNSNGYGVCLLSRFAFIMIIKSFSTLQPIRYSMRRPSISRSTATLYAMLSKKVSLLLPTFEANSNLMIFLLRHYILLFFTY